MVLGFVAWLLFGPAGGSSRFVRFSPENPLSFYD